MDSREDHNRPMKRVKTKDDDNAQPLRRSVREIAQKPVQNPPPSPPPNRKNMAVKKIKPAKELVPLQSPWNILKLDEIGLIAKALAIEDCFCLEDAYPGTAIAQEIQSDHSEQENLYLILDPYIYESNLRSPYGLKYPYKKVSSRMPTMPLMPSPPEDLEPENEEKNVIGYNTLLNLGKLNSIKRIFPLVKSLKIVMRDPTAKGLKDLGVILSLFRNQLVSLQLFIGESYTECDRKAEIEFCKLLNTNLNLPKLQHLLLDVDEEFWYNSSSQGRSETAVLYPHLKTLFGQVEECFLRIGTEYTVQQFDTLKSNASLRKLGIIPYGHINESDREKLTQALINCSSGGKGLAEKIVHLYPLVINLSTFPQLINSLHLFTELTHFSFKVTVNPGDGGRNNYIRTLHAIKDLHNLTELFVKLNYKKDADFEKAFFQLLRLPQVKVLKFKLKVVDEKKENFLDHNLFTTLSVTRQFPNLKTFIFRSNDDCSLCKCELVNTNLNCYNQLIQPVTNLRYLEEFRTSHLRWDNILYEEFDDANTQILQTIKDRREVDGAAAEQHQ